MIELGHLHHVHELIDAAAAQVVGIGHFCGQGCLGGFGDCGLVGAGSWRYQLGPLAFGRAEGELGHAPATHVAGDREGHVLGPAPLVGLLVALSVVLVTAPLLGPLVLGLMRYRTSPTTLNQLLGSDAAAMFVIAPLGLVAALLVHCRSPAGPSLAAGIGVYAVYTYAQVIVGQEYLRLPGNVEKFFPLLLASQETERVELGTGIGTALAQVVAEVFGIDSYQITAPVMVDEPALRELLPLRQREHADYLRWSVGSFKLATSGVAAATQIHTHLCYSEFGEIIDAIDALDADVTSIEAARSRMEVVQDLEQHGFARGVGPGIYDIHSPRIPSAGELQELLAAAVAHVPVRQLWVNPDCGLKTRAYPETKASLENLVEAARTVRASLVDSLAG